MTITKGIAFPLTIDKGNLLVSQEGELFRGHILSWLLTEINQRVMRPSYGMKDPLFESLQDMSVVTSEVREGLIKYIPDVDFQVEGSINDLGEAVITVYWQYQDKEQIITVTI
jgi:phage baseplate assembly protein W